MWNPIDDFFKSIVEQFQASASEDLQGSINALSSVRWPDWNSDWFKYLYGNTLSVGILIMTVIIAISAFVVMVSRNGFSRILNVTRDSVYLMFFGTLFPLFMGIGTYASDTLTLIPINIGKWAAGGDWLINMKLPGLPGLIDAVWMSFLIKFFSLIMRGEVTIIQYSLYIFGILSVLGFALRNTGQFGNRLWRLCVSAIIAGLFAKPLMMFFVAMGSVILKFAPGDNSLATYWTLVLVQFFSALSYIILIIASNRKYVSIFGDGPKSEVEGKVDIGKLPSRGQLEHDTIESTTQSFTKITEPALSSRSPELTAPTPRLSDIARDAAKSASNKVVDAAIISGATYVGGTTGTAVGKTVVAGKHTIQAQHQIPKGAPGGVSQ